MSETSDQSEKNDSGFALFVVLSFLMIAVAITTPFLVSARIDALVSRNLGQSTRDKILLHGIIEIAAARYFELYQRRDKKPIKNTVCRLPVGDLEFEFQDHGGLIDLNAASNDVLALGFESLSVTTESAKEIANQVVRFRSIEGTQSLPSLEVIPLHGFKHALFEHVSELQDLLVSANIQAKQIDEVFTVHSGTGTVDQAAASPRLLMAIEKRAAGEQYFLVTDTRRTNAVTITITQSKSNGQQVQAKAVLGRGQNGVGVAMIGPMLLESQAQDKPLKSAAARANCVDFFDPVLLQVLQEVTS